MSTVAISDLPVATVINATDIIPFVQPAVAGTTKTITKTLLFTSPALVTPNIGAATGTSLALTGLATVGTTLGVTGVSTLTAGAVVQGLTVGLGNNAVVKNTALGVSALQNNSPFSVSGGDELSSSNTAVGYETLKANLQGFNNTALGTRALTSNTYGDYNVAIGTAALRDNETGSANTSVGDSSMLTNVSGDYNVAVGSSALSDCVSGNNNTAIGLQALFVNTTSNNTAVGFAAGLYSAGASNTAVGYQAYSGVLSSTTGTFNTVIGAGSGSALTSGGKNVILGSYSGNQGSLDIRTASNYVVLSDGDGNPRAYWNGANATFNGDLTVSGTGNINATSITTNNASISTFIAMSGTAGSIVSAGTITPTKEITYISGTNAIATITPQAPITGANGTIILIPTGAFTWTTAGNIAIAGTAVFGRALHMTYTTATNLWYPSYV